MQVLTYIYVLTIWCVGTILSGSSQIPSSPLCSSSSSSLQALRQSQAGLCASRSAPMSSAQV
jgi:hypothetical protein